MPWGTEMTDHTDNLPPLPDTQVVPHGWKLAPEKPTPDMRAAGHAAWTQATTAAALEDDPGPERDGPHANIAAAYRAMLSAAPQPAAAPAQAAEPVALPHKHDGDTAAAVGNLMFALETWKATTPRTAPPAFATLVQSCADLVSAARTSQAAEPVRAIDPDAVYEGMREIDPAWNAHGRDREYAVAVALTVVNRMLSAAPQLAAAKPEGGE